MALDLTMQITADASQARAELRAVEGDVKRVEAANKSSVTWWQKEENALTDVSAALEEHRGKLSKVEQASVAMAAQTENAAAASLQLGGAAETATAQLLGMSGTSSDLATQLLAMAGASELSLGAILGLSAGLGAVLGAGIAFGAFLLDSAKYYEEHASAAKGLRVELEQVGEAWNTIRTIVGGALMDGANEPMVAILKLGTEWAIQYGVKLAADIELAKKLIDLGSLGGFSRQARVFSETDPGNIPDPVKVLGGKSSLPMPEQYQPLSGSLALQIFDRQEAERRRQELDAARDAARLAEEIQRVHDRYIESLRRRADSELRIRQASEQAANFAAFGNYAARLPIAKGFGIYGLNPKTYGLPTNDWLDEGKPRNDFIGLTGLDPKKLGKPEPFFNPVSKDVSFLSRLFGGSSGLGADLSRMFEGLLVNTGSASSAVGGSIGGSVMSALMKGGTGKAISGALSGVLGKTIGGIAGSFLGPLGSMAGAWLGGKISAALGPTQYQKDAKQANASIADLWKALQGQYGGAKGADSALSMFGFNPADLKGKNFQGAMGLDPLKETFAELQRRQAQFNTDLGGTLGKITALGGGIAPALQPYLDKLIDAKVLTQENLDLIAKMAGDTKPTWQQMEEVARKYNLTIDQLGPTFQKQKLNASFQQIIDDVDLLVRGGADGVTQLSGLGEEIQSLVQQSIDFGTAIPDNMKPWIQKLIDAGLLLGKTGEKITDINSLTFGDSMQTTLEKLNKTLKDLIDSLNVGLPGATKRAADAWKDNFDDLPMPGNGGRGGGGSGGDGGGDAPPAAAARPAYGRVVLQVSGRTVAQSVVPFIPGVVTKYGLTRG